LKQKQTEELTLNVFVTSPWPAESAIVLPDRHITKMPLECCQMLSIVASKWYHNYGTLAKKDGTPYATEKGAFRNHPCTQWVAESIHNAYWLIKHGMNLCDEFHLRYGKHHSCYNTLLGAYYIFPKGKITDVTPFVRAMPDEIKLDTTINTFDAYKMYINTKIWVRDNYLRMPERKPSWVN
jgi:hypothetical protein